MSIDFKDCWLLPEIGPQLALLEEVFKDVAKWKVERYKGKRNLLNRFIVSVN